MNVNMLKKAGYTARQAYNNAATLLEAGAPVELSVAEYDACSIGVPAIPISRFYGVLAGRLNPYDGTNQLVREGVIAARVKAAATATPGAWLWPETATQNFEVVTWPSGIMLLTDLSGLTNGTVYGPDTANTPLVEIMPWATGGVATIEDIISFYDCRVWDSSAVLVTTAANDDLALIVGTLGTDAPLVKGSDIGGTSTAGQYLAFTYRVPATFIPGGSLTARARAYMQVVADDSATIDMQAYRLAAPTVDICATAAQSINSATPANKDFSFTTTNVVPNEILLIRVGCAATDAGNAANNINAVISQLSMLAERRV